MKSFYNHNVTRVATEDGLYTIEKSQNKWRLVHDGYGVIASFSTKKAALERLIEVYSKEEANEIIL